MAAAQVANRLAALEAAVAQLPALLARIEALEAQVAAQAAAAAPAPKRRKKPTLWWTAVGAAALPTVPPGVPPKTAETTAPLRAARLVLVRQFWPNIAGTGGAESCAVCHANGVAWGKCRGYGGSALNHGPNVPDASDKFPVGAYVQSTAVTGQVTAYDAASGFHTVTPAAGAAKSLFLVHKSYAAVCVLTAPTTRQNAGLPSLAGARTPLPHLLSLMARVSLALASMRKYLGQKLRTPPIMSASASSAGVSTNASSYL